MIPDIEPFAAAGISIPSGALVTPGGPQGLAGPTAASTDAGNQAVLGSDGKIFVPPIPPATIWDYGGPNAPTGWLLTNGAAVSRTAYAALYAALGGASSPWGQGDGSTTFNVPDLRGRAALGAGQGTGLTNRILGATGGEETHLLTAAELASHTHTATSTQGTHTHTDSGHSHSLDLKVNCAAGAGAYGPVFPGTGTASQPSGTASSVISTVSAGAITTTVTATAAGVSHNTMAPFAVLNKIIKT